MAIRGESSREAGVGGQAEVDLDMAQPNPEREQVQSLMEYKNRLEPVTVLVHEMRKSYSDAVQAVREFHATNESFRERVASLGLRRPDDYLVHLETMAVGSPVRWDVINETLQKAQAAAEALSLGSNTRELFLPYLEGNGQAPVTRIPDLDDLKAHANRYLEFYAKLKPLLQPGNFPTEEEAQAKLLVGNQGSGRIKRIAISPRLQQELTDRPFSEIQDRVLKQDQDDKLKQ